MPRPYSPLPTPWNTSAERLRTRVLAKSLSTLLQPALPPPHRSTSIVTLEYADPEFAGSVKAMLPLNFGVVSSSQVFGPCASGIDFVFCRTTSRCRFVPIQRSCGSRNSAGIAFLCSEA